jgi:hypothetical protein
LSHITAIRDGMSASDEKDLSNIAVAFISSGGGVVGTGDYLVAAQTSPNATVKIAAGRAYVPTSDATMVYATVYDASPVINVTIGANSSGSPRIDTIVLYCDLSASPDSAADNVAKFFAVQGTPAGSPAAPNNAAILSAIGSSNPYIKLADIAVANGFTSITSGNITDDRTTVAFTTGQSVPVNTYEEFTDQSSVVSAPASGKTRLFTKSGGVFAKVNGGKDAQLGATTLEANGNSGTSQTVDWSTGNTQSYTLTGNCTFTFANPTAGQHLTLILTQDGTGSRTASWPATVKWSNAVAPVLSTVAGKIDLIGFIWDNVSYYAVSSLTY